MILLYSIQNIYLSSSFFSLKKIIHFVKWSINIFLRITGFSNNCHPCFYFVDRLIYWFKELLFVWEKNTVILHFLVYCAFRGMTLVDNFPIFVIIFRLMHLEKSYWLAILCVLLNWTRMSRFSVSKVITLLSAICCCHFQVNVSWQIAEEYLQKIK